MPEVRSVSISEISAFLDCRRRWALGYVRQLGLITRSLTGAANLGTRVHLALGAYYEERDPFAALEAKRAEEVELCGSMEIVSSLEEIEKEHLFARLIVEGYLDWLEETGADLDYEVRAVEKRVEAPSPLPERYTLRGKCDLLLQQKSTGYTGIRDFKTVGSLTAGLPILNLTPQARMYALLERLNSSTDWPQFVTWAMLLKSKRTTRSKPPYYAHYDIHFNEAELKKFWVRLHGVLSDMARCEDALAEGQDFVAACYPRPSTECTWKCKEFLPICALFDDPESDVEHVLETAYAHQDPYARYDDASESAPVTG